VSTVKPGLTPGFWSFEGVACSHTFVFQSVCCFSLAAILALGTYWIWRSGKTPALVNSGGFDLPQISFGHSLLLEVWLLRWISAPFHLTGGSFGPGELWVHDP